MNTKRKLKCKIVLEQDLDPMQRVILIEQIDNLSDDLIDYLGVSEVNEIMEDEPVVSIPSNYCLLTDLADELGISYGTLQGAVRRGKVDSIKIENRLYVNPEDFDEYNEKHDEICSTEDNDEYMLVSRKIAESLGVNFSSIYNPIYSEQIRSFKRPDGRRLVHKQDFYDYFTNEYSPVNNAAEPKKPVINKIGYSFNGASS